MLGGTTYEAYHSRRKTNADSFDPVDAVIFKAARRMEKRYSRAFGLLYSCTSKEESCKRLQQRGHKPISTATLDRYRVYIENRIIELIENSPDLLRDLKAAID